jgi:hypothetical protein
MHGGTRNKHYRTKRYKFPYICPIHHPSIYISLTEKLNGKMAKSVGQHLLSVK